MKRKFKKEYFFHQSDAMDCGPACLKMISRFYGKMFRIERLRELCFLSREGVSLFNISDAAEKIGFRTQGVKISFNGFYGEVKLPCIVHWNQDHFVVLCEVKKGKVVVADPSYGIIEYSTKDFIRHWADADEDEMAEGICLMIEPSPKFYKTQDDKEERGSFSFLFQYLLPHKKFIFQLFLGFVIGSLLQLIFPFLTQAIVDIGINTEDIDFIYIILLAQIVLIASRLSVEFIRSWILLHISTRINIALISDFLIKLMNLPIRFFDSKMTGDIIQRIEDHKRIEQFLTSQLLAFAFSIVNIFVFGMILIAYSFKIFLVFAIGSALYLFWIKIFMSRRKEVDYRRFRLMSGEQSNLIQLVTGMQEIKLNRCEKQKRWEWEGIQTKLFRVSTKGLSIAQYQQIGGLFFNESKNIIITIMAALLVVNGQLSLGAMLAIQYILGQLNGPIDQMIEFFHSAQDAKLSLDRLLEVYRNEDEDDESISHLTEIPSDRKISVDNITFQYEGPTSPKVLNNISLEIPENKVTAIVGTSGSGKTTLIKLLLGFYNPVEGNVFVGPKNLKEFHQGWWRGECGVVMQEGFIFSDTITRNIAVGDEVVDRERLIHAVEMANISEFINSLPLGFNTQIGQEGIGLSQGQKQRLLISRAIYKDPKYIFLDEATNALDANNEKVILDNLESFYKGRTVLVVAHRLSTVKNADQIVVLDKGRIVERGTHLQLIEKEGYYYNLVKNQLEIGVS
ncbi:MAG: peptidase domain-containing ABC transporter [Marinifilaceae bacterium]